MGDKAKRAGSQHPCTQQKPNEPTAGKLGTQQRFVLQLLASFICPLLLAPPLFCRSIFCCSSLVEFIKLIRFCPGLPAMEGSRISSSSSSSAWAFHVLCLLWDLDLRPLVTYHKVRGASRTGDIQITYSCSFVFLKTWSAGPLYLGLQIMQILMLHPRHLEPEGAGQ